MTDREKFEQVETEISRKNGYSERAISRILRKDEHGEYVISGTRVAYAYWQAGLKSAIPKGYVLVPEQPTPSMISAGAEAARLHGTHLGCDCEFVNPDDVWEAMLDAAPTVEISSDERYRVQHSDVES